jgi:hypothetical protein
MDPKIRGSLFSGKQYLKEKKTSPYIPANSITFCEGLDTGRYMLKAYLKVFSI